MTLPRRSEVALRCHRTRLYDGPKQIIPRSVGGRHSALQLRGALQLLGRQMLTAGHTALSARMFDDSDSLPLSHALSLTEGSADRFGLFSPEFCSAEYPDATPFSPPEPCHKNVAPRRIAVRRLASRGRPKTDPNGLRSPVDRDPPGGIQWCRERKRRAGEAAVERARSTRHAIRPIPRARPRKPEPYGYRGWVHVQFRPAVVPRSTRRCAVDRATGACAANNESCRVGVWR